MMQWENLLSLRKHGDTKKRLRTEEDDTRSSFEVDYDRVIFSSAFRSLQDKTQVIPMSQTSFVHTRLTHSLEVSVVGRSLGRKVGHAVIDKHPHLQKIHGYQVNDFGAIVAAAALAHDIGNPPFGHSGEKAIGNYFSHGRGSRFKQSLTPEEYQDLVEFEGNANGFRILTESRNGIQGGLRLTYATLGAFMKYPKESLPKKPTPHIADKKYGVLQQDLESFKDVVETLGLKKRGDKHLGFARHPLAYLVEAADDICYTVIDFEDGINLGLISEETALEYLINLVKDAINTKAYSALTQMEDRLAYLRSLAIGTLIDEAVRVFIENEEAILDGSFEHALLDRSRFKAQIDDIIAESVVKVYQSKEVIDKEIAGYKILTGLLDRITAALEAYYSDASTHYDSLLLKSLNIALPEEQSTYQYLMLGCGYVSGLTDGNAMRLFQKVEGQL